MYSKIKQKNQAKYDTYNLTLHVFDLEVQGDLILIGFYSIIDL